MKMGVIGKVLSFSPYCLKLSLNVGKVSFVNVTSLSFMKLTGEANPRDTAAENSKLKQSKRSFNW